MKRVRQAAFPLLAVFLSACQFADTDSPARLKQALEKSGWSEIGAGTAGYSIGLGGIERHVEGIRAERATPAGKLSLAVGRFNAKIGWMAAVTGGSPDSVTISGAGLLLDSSKTQFWWPDFDWPAWPGETAEALNGAFADGRGNSPSGAAFNMVAKIGDSDAPVTVEFRGTAASATAVIQRETDRISFGIKRTALEGSRAVYEFTPDIGTPIGPVAIDLSKPSMELLGPADLSLAASFLLKDAMLKLGKGSAFATDTGGFGFTVADVEAGLLGKLTLKGSVSVRKSPEKTLATFKLGEYPAVFEWTGDKLSRVELVGKESDLKWPIETGKLATLAVAEFLQPYWGGKAVDLSEMVFRKLSVSNADRLFGFETAAAEKVQPQISVRRWESRKDNQEEWREEYNLSGLTVRLLASSIPKLKGIENSSVWGYLRLGRSTQEFKVFFEKVDQPLKYFADPALSVVDIFKEKTKSSIFDSVVSSMGISIEYNNSRLTRVIYLNTDLFDVIPMPVEKNGNERLPVLVWHKPGTRPPFPNIGNLIVTGPLFSPKIDFADGESRGRFLELMAKEFK